jgi:hypothetical protein
MRSIWSLRKDLFRRIRSAGYQIRGWVGVVEYPNHLHIVMDSEYIPQQQVSKIWKAVTAIPILSTQCPHFLNLATVGFDKTLC